MESGGGREQSRPLTAEEEALKRNTDCVYFLASPLTCKKGTECEYRHSEGARVNPRDCWYWLNGNCLNAKCTFRHPPLDGLIGMLGTASELAPPPSQTVAFTHVPAAHGPAGFNLNKQNVPCYYFQQGHCLKGDRCSFMHGPQQRDNPVPQQYTSPPNPVSPLKKESWCLKERTSQQSIHKADFDKPVEVPLAPVKPSGKSENVLNNGFAIKETASPYPSEDGLPRFQQSDVPDRSGIALGWPRSQQSQPLDDYLQNARETDEFLRESSPGFDVLVNNNMEDSEYFHDEGDFERVPAQDARNLNNVRDFYYRHSDHESVPNFERDQYNGVGVHDRSGRLDNWYGREQQRTTSERILERAMHEKRMLQGEESYHDIDGSDLRHRLLKQRRPNSSKSTFSPDHGGKLYQRHNYFVDEERSRAHHACRGHRRFPMETSISSRLQGRITLPARSSPDRLIDLQSERNRDRGRHGERSLPARPVNYKGRHHDKTERRPVFSDVRNAGVQPIRREEVDPLNFAGPKSLAELKGAKLSENLQDQKKIKLGKPLGHQESDGFLSFEGPKPLSVILKRKRENAPGNGANFCNGDKNTQRDNVGGIGSSVFAAIERDDNHTANCSKDSKLAGVDEEKEVGIIPMEGQELPNDDQTLAGGNTHEVEDGMIAGSTDDQELENYGQRDGESDYEEVEDEEFKPEDAENTCQEDEEDDDDDFAKKVGVIFS